MNPYGRRLLRLKSQDGVEACLALEDATLNLWPTRLEQQKNRVSSSRGRALSLNGRVGRDVPSRPWPKAVTP
jgi:hypothetical protein